MSAMIPISDSLPPCGIYRTQRGLKGKEEWVRENLLVYFHNHSQQGPPLVLLPAVNTHNRWTFHDKGYLVRDTEFVDFLQPLRPEGYYVLNEPFPLSPDEYIHENTLIQIGYNRTAEPIMFVAEFEDNSIVFPNVGLKCTTDLFDLIRSVDFRVPEVRGMH